MKKRYYKAFTLQEVMVVMIITGVVFIAVMDGFRLFGRFAAIAENNINSDLEIYNNSLRLERLTEMCDTIYSNKDSLVIIEQSDSLAFLILDPASLIALNEGNKTDTLFSHASSIHLMRGEANHYCCDTIIISVKQNKTENYTNMKYIKDYSKKRSSYD